MANYVEEARKYLKGSYDTAVANLNNNFNQNMRDMDNQTANMNKQYDASIQGAKDTGQINKANFNNSMLNRGMSRSTIATSGITGINNTTASNVNKLEVERQSQLANISSLKDMLRNNLTNSLNAQQSDYNSKLSEYAMQLKQRDEDMAYRNAQAEQQRKEWQAEQNWKQKNFDNDNYWKQLDYDLSKKKAESSASSSASKFNLRDYTNETDSAIKEALSSGDVESADYFIQKAKLNGVADDTIKDWQSSLSGGVNSSVKKSLDNYAKTGTLDYLSKYTSDGKKITKNKKYIDPKYFSYGE